MDELEKLTQENTRLRLALSHARAELNASSWPDYQYDYDDDRLSEEMDALGIEAITMEPLPPKELSAEELAEREAANAKWREYREKHPGNVVRVTYEDIVNNDLGLFSPSVRLRQSPSS